MDHHGRWASHPSARLPLLQSVGQIVCAFADAGAREQACDALRGAEFDSSDLTLLDAAQMSARLNEEIEGYEADPHNCWQQVDVARRLQETASHGGVWLLVMAPHDWQVLIAQRLLRAHGARRAVHFGSMWIEDLTTRR